MTTNNQDLMCGDAAALVGYLYGECDALERVRMERHLETCDACATELTELGGARQYLSAWTPPEAVLGFRIATERPAPGRADAPGMVAAADAGVGAGGRRGGAVRLGHGRRQPLDRWQHSRRATESARATVSADALAQLETRMKQEIAALRSAPAAPAPGSRVERRGRGSDPAAGAAADSRKRGPAGRGVHRPRGAAGARRRDPAARRPGADAADVEQMQGTTSEEVRRQREMLNYLVNVSQRR